MCATRRLLVLVLAAGLVAASCSSGGDDPDVVVRDQQRGAGIAAEVASYDLVAGRRGRFIVGLFASDKTRLVAFGAVELAFAYRGSAQNPRDGAFSDAVQATFLPIPGQEVDPAAPGPRFVTGSEATGVYGAADVGFDRSGFWEVQITATIEGRTHTTTSAFEVLADSNIPAPGEPAPRAAQALATDPGVNPRSIDSRAGPDRPVPDPELHDTTIAAALDAHRPFVVVVSTPTYCQSRFCGPITDSVQGFARRYLDRITFAHLEVWRDFEAGDINPAAAEWIFPPGAEDAREPWVFVVGADGIVRERFDNVATDTELQAAIDRLLAE